jgi:glycyl-tRNA synthetase
LGIADRLDSLAGLFAVGLTPTGSADPYGLRRAALGLVQILIGGALPFSISEGLAEAGQLLPVEASEASLAAAQSFVIGRLEGLLREEGFAYDVVQAVLAEQGDDPYRAHLAAQALSAWVAREEWEALLDNYARCVRITRDKPRYALDAGRFEMEAERQLYEALLQAEAGVERGDVNSLMAQLQVLIAPIRRFFDEVLVMAEDEAVRRNRLALLQRIAALTAGTVDLSRMEGF